MHAHHLTRDLRGDGTWIMLPMRKAGTLPAV